MSSFIIFNKLPERRPLWTWRFPHPLNQEAFHFTNTISRTRDTAQHVTVLATHRRDPSSIPGTQKMDWLSSHYTLGQAPCLGIAGQHHRCSIFVCFPHCELLFCFRIFCPIRFLFILVFILFFWGKGVWIWSWMGREDLRGVGGGEIWSKYIVWFFSPFPAGINDKQLLG